MANPSEKSRLSRIIDRFIPPATDFFVLLAEQCENAAACSSALVSYMKTEDRKFAEQVKALEHAGDGLKSRNLEALHRAFSTPIDREDIFRAITTIDTILNYVKTTVREMRLLKLPPDQHTVAMAEILNEGVHDLLQGFRSLQKQADRAGEKADRAIKAERRIEAVYREALAELFDAGHYLETLTDAHRTDASTLKPMLKALEPDEKEAVATSVAFVVEILKRREVYRHMSNAGDRLALAGENLRDIVVKIT